jgi:1,4-dihydroxy-2-naphthoyl-CoA synthase
LILLELPFDAKRAADLGLVTQVVSDQNLLATATETARKLAAKPAGALQGSKRLMKRPFREQIKAAMKVENEEFSAHVRSEDAKEAFTAFLEKRPPDFTRDDEICNGRIGCDERTAGIPRHPHKMLGTRAETMGPDGSKPRLRSSWAI